MRLRRKPAVQALLFSQNENGHCRRVGTWLQQSLSDGHASGAKTMDKQSFKRVPLTKRQCKTAKGNKSGGKHGRTTATSKNATGGTKKTKKNDNASADKATKQRADISQGRTGTVSSSANASLAQVALVKRVNVGSTISVYWEGDDEYFSALVTRWRRRRGVTLFRLIYDDGYREDDVNLFEERFDIIAEEPRDDGASSRGEGGTVFV